MKIIVSGGKTGGHLIPGIAIYEEVKKRKIDTLYIMSATDLKYPVAERVKKSDRVLLDLQNISRKLSWKTPLYLIKILSAFFRIFGTVLRFRPDAVIITGGYISNPVALSAVILRIPLFIAEQNSVAGITNRFYAHFARKIFINFPGTKKIPLGKAVLTGNPTLFSRSSGRDASRRFFRMEKYSRVIGISGGSQGALKVNNAVSGILDYCVENHIGVVWSLGAVDFKRFEENGKLKELEKARNIRCFRFISRMDLFLSCADMVISRAGATSVTEFIQYGVPSLLIPIKNSPDNHQKLNADIIVKGRGGLMIEEDDLNKERLQDSVRSLLLNKSKFRKNLVSLRKKLYGKPAAVLILDAVEKSMAF